MDSDINICCSKRLNSPQCALPKDFKDLYRILGQFARIVWRHHLQRSKIVAMNLIQVAFDELLPIVISRPLQDSIEVKILSEQVYLADCRRIQGQSFTPTGKPSIEIG